MVIRMKCVLEKSVVNVLQHGLLSFSCMQTCAEDTDRKNAQVWGLNSSVGSELGSLSCMMQRCGFDPPPLRIF